MGLKNMPAIQSKCKRADAQSNGFPLQTIGTLGISWDLMSGVAALCHSCTTQYLTQGHGGPVGRV